MHIPREGPRGPGTLDFADLSMQALRLPIAIATVAALSAVANALGDEVGFEELLARLGAGAPTGSSVSVAQVEAQESAGNFGPNRTLGEFSGKTFTDMSGPSGASGHATFVGQNFYGSSTSIARGVLRIWTYEAASFAQGASLNVGNAAALPQTPPGGAQPVRVFNHSWIGSFGTASLDNEVLRRADFAMNRDDTLYVCGENNGAGSQMQPLMSMCYNGIAVGLTSGGHSAGDVPAGIDGSGRMKPELVAPGQFTSFSTPVVSAAAALLYDAATAGSAATNANRRKGVTVKSALLCGATHAASWSNQAPATGPSRGITSKPLDPVYGCGTVNVDRSHRIITAGEALGASSPAGAIVANSQPLVAWDWENFTQSFQRHYRLEVPVQCDASFLVAWNRSPLAQWSGGVAPATLNLRLELRRVSAGAAASITGDAGLGVFAGGNVLSQSAVDNVEHLYVRGLQPGSYVLSVTRDDSQSISAGAAVAWFIDVPAVLGDLDGNGLVNGADLGLLLGAWGTAGPGDLNGDGIVNGADLGLLLGAWD
jgi:hypothetical protein